MMELMHQKTSKKFIIMMKRTMSTMILHKKLSITVLCNQDTNMRFTLDQMKRLNQDQLLVQDSLELYRAQMPVDTTYLSTSSMRLKPSQLKSNNKRKKLKTMTITKRWVVVVKMN